MGSDNIKEEILKKIDMVGEPDYIAINSYIKYGSEIVNTISGLILTLIAMSFVLIIAIEVAYLTFSGFRNKLDGLMVETQGMKRRVYEVVLHDAKNSYREYIERGTNAHLMGIYLKRKIVVIFIYGVVFSITVGYGKEYVTVIEKMLSGVFRQIFKVF